MKYLDTVVESTDRIKKARENINKTIILLFIGFVFTGFIGFVFYLWGYVITGIYFECMAILYMLLIVGLVVKREIFSLAVIMKNIGGS